MAFLNIMGRAGKTPSQTPLADFLQGWSIEVMPRTAAKIEDFRALLPRGTRVYIAHIADTPIDDMVATARRLRDEGFEPMPHIAARGIADAATLESWIGRYREEAGVIEALLLGGGHTAPVGTFDSSIAMIETGLFDRFGFKRLHIAGHPEGSRDIDRDSTTANVDTALLWKQNFADRTDADMAIVTQFAFDAQVVIDWAERIKALGVTLPIHVGVAGPAKLQTLIQFAISCGIGPSLKVLQKRAMDVTRLLKPYEPTDVLSGLADYKRHHPESLIAQAHVFPLGGITAAAEWMNIAAPPEQVPAER